MKTSEDTKSLKRTIKLRKNILVKIIIAVTTKTPTYRMKKWIVISKILRDNNTLKMTSTMMIVIVNNEDRLSGTDHIVKLINLAKSYKNQIVVLKNLGMEKNITAE